MPLVDSSYWNRLEKIFRDFIWKGKSSKIAWSILQANKDEGGLSLISLRNKDKAMKIQWVFLEDNLIKELAAQLLNSGCDDIIWQCQLKEEHIVLLNPRQNFWTDTLRIWCGLSWSPPTSKKQVEEQIIWWNSNILIDGKPFCWKKWCDKGVTRIADILVNNEFMSIVQIKRKYQFQPPFTELYGLIQAIPKDWKNKIKIESDQRENISPFQFYKAHRPVAKLVYTKLNSNLTVLQLLVFKWQKEIPKLDLDLLIRYTKHTYLVTNYVKLRSF